MSATPFALANWPFVSSTARTGSFLGGSPEDTFMEIGQRVRIFALRSDGDLIWTPDPAFPSDTRIVLPDGEPFYVESGRYDMGQADPVPGYAMEEELLTDFRYTRVQNKFESGGIPQLSEIYFGAQADFVEDRDIDGSGLFDSYATFTARNGDITGTLTTDPSGAFRGSGLSISTRIRGQVFSSANLQIVDSTDYPDQTFTCSGGIYLDAFEWWPYKIDGTPTWDINTGNKLASELRGSATNSDSRFFFTVP